MRDLAAANGWLRYHVLGQRFGPAGFPDLVLSRGDIFALVELKRAHGPRGGTTRSSGAGVDPSPAQRAWLGAAGRARWVVSAVWRPGDVPRIAAFLAGEDPEAPGLWNPRDVARETATPGEPRGPTGRRVNVV